MGSPSTVTHIDGRIIRLGQGLYHESYFFRQDDDSDILPGDDCVFRAIVISHYASGQEWAAASTRLSREAKTLQALAGFELTFGVPRMLCLTYDNDRKPTGLLETFIPGLPVDEYKQTPEQRERAIDQLAQVAAGIHRLPVAKFSHLSAYANRHEHVQAKLTEVQTMPVNDDDIAQQAIAWIGQHLPDQEPCSVLHGDLLPQNVHWDSTEERLGVIDWEEALVGDPAYDLAIVTRGQQKLIRTDNGLNRLLQKYNVHADKPLRLHDVVVHELLLNLDWLGDSIIRRSQGDFDGFGPDAYRNQLRSILRRNTGSC